MEEERFNYSTNDATRFVDELKDRAHDLYDENKRLKERIDEAIEYIENTYIGSILEVHSGYEEEYTKPLLDILKGVDKE